MSDHKYELAIAYRIYPNLAKNVLLPEVWKDKLHFSEVCLGSLIRGLDGVRYKLYALLDGCGPEYEEMFRRNCPDVDILKFDHSIGNKGTFAAQIDLLLEQTDAEAVMFAEDDYFYMDGAIAEMIGLLKRVDVDFITPYDHPDLYARKDLHNYKSEVVYSGKRHWKTVASACLTFMTTRGVLAETASCFKSYRKISDLALWLAVTKLKRFDAPRSTMKRMYKHNFLHLMTSRPYSLWSPMPSLATHMVATHAAPVMDWAGIIKKYI